MDRVSFCKKCGKDFAWRLKTCPHCGQHEDRDVVPAGVQVFEAEVAGESHTNADGSDRQDILRRARVGAVVDLLHEPGNRHDKNAVRVVIRDSGKQIGYLPREDAAVCVREQRAGTRYIGAIRAIIGGTLEKPSRRAFLLVLAGGAGHGLGSGLGVLSRGAPAAATVRADAIGVGPPAQHERMLKDLGTWLLERLGSKWRHFATFSTASAAALVFLVLAPTEAGRIVGAFALGAGTAAAIASWVTARREPSARRVVLVYGTVWINLTYTLATAAVHNWRFLCPTCELPMEDQADGRNYCPKCKNTSEVMGPDFVRTYYEGRMVRGWDPGRHAVRDLEDR